MCARGGLPDWLAAKAPKSLKTNDKKSVISVQESAPPNGSELRSYMRQWRSRMAWQEGVPSHIVLNDASLDDLCRKQPSTKSELTQVLGIGEIKAERYWEDINAAMGEFALGARVDAKPDESNFSPAEDTIRLLAEGKTFRDIAILHGRSVWIVVNRAATLVESGRLAYSEQWVRPGHRKLIDEMIAVHGTNRLGVLKTSLPDEIAYDEIRLVVAVARRAG